MGKPGESPGFFVMWKHGKHSAMADEDIVFIRERTWRTRYVLSVPRPTGNAGAWGQIVARIPAGWSEAQIARMLQRHRRWISQRRQELAAQQQKKAARTAMAEVFCEFPESWYRKAARKSLKRLCDRWAAVMGLEYGKLRITGARSRWGSCSSRGDLSFSWRLLATRWDLVEYVVVHELAHRVHFDHSPRFWNLVARYVPDYEAKRRDLRLLGGEVG